MSNVREKTTDELIEEIETLQADIGLLRGAIAAADEMMLKAAERAGVEYFGCDTAELLADEILGLREEIERLQTVIAHMEAEAER